MITGKTKGYAVMSEDLNGYSISNINIDVCKQYCRGTDVVVEWLPVVYGFTITLTWNKFYKLKQFPYIRNIPHLHLSISKEYRHISGKIVYRNPKKDTP
ncbi:MAG: hypothetical protein PHU98_06325 [Mariniphaga sp.]|nr:hypothetical protein [Mariniphaga sp.]